MILYAATSNKGKLAEFASCASSAAGPGKIDVLALPNLDQIPEPVEDAPSFMGNAEIKAIAYSLAALASGAKGLLVFADDSGLEVDALHGEPGVRSARYADDAGFFPTSTTVSSRPEQDSSTVLRSGETCISGGLPPPSKDHRNNTLLLSRLAALPAGTPRSARFVCALALARDGHILLRAEGFVEGEILHSPRGENGFGYDPLFLIPSAGLTAAELPADRKWSLSHRGNAFRNLLAQLDQVNP